MQLGGWTEPSSDSAGVKARNCVCARACVGVGRESEWWRAEWSSASASGVQFLCGLSVWLEKACGVW
jgi:hypothetical protein